MADRNAVYADALLAIIHAEGNADETTDELFRFSQSLQNNDELWSALSDPHIPAEKRQQIVTDLNAVIHALHFNDIRCHSCVGTGSEAYSEYEQC